MIDATGYVPHASGRYLRMGAVVPTLRNATFAAGVEAVQRRLAEDGCKLGVSSADYRPEIEAQAAAPPHVRPTDHSTEF